MTFTIDGIALADKQLTREVTELVRITAPELLAQDRPRRRLGGRVAVAAAVLIGAAAIGWGLAGKLPPVTSHSIANEVRRQAPGT